MLLFNKRFGYCSVLAIIWLTQTQAQSNSYPVLSMQAECTAVANFMSDSVINFNPSTVFSATILVVLEDTINITSLEVKFGRTSSNILLQRSFAFDNTSPGGGCTYSRSGYNVVLGLGSNFIDVPLFYAEMRLTRSDNSSTQLFTYYQ